MSDPTELLPPGTAQRKTRAYPLLGNQDHSHTLALQILAHVLLPLLKCSLFFLHHHQAQVEAKKEHEGAVQLLEVSTGWVRRGGAGRTLWSPENKWYPPHVRNGMWPQHPAAHIILASKVSPRHHYHCVLTTEETAQRNKSTFPQPHSLGQSGLWLAVLRT